MNAFSILVGRSLRRRLAAKGIISARRGHFIRSLWNATPQAANRGDFVTYGTGLFRTATNCPRCPHDHVNSNARSGGHRSRRCGVLGCTTPWVIPKHNIIWHTHLNISAYAFIGICLTRPWLAPPRRHCRLARLRNAESMY